MFRYVVEQEEVGEPIKTRRAIVITPYYLEGPTKILTAKEIKYEALLGKKLPRVKIEIEPPPPDNALAVYKYTYELGGEKRSAPMIYALLNKLELRRIQGKEYPEIEGLVGENVYDILSKIWQALKIEPEWCKTVFAKLNLRELHLGGTTLETFYKTLPSIIMRTLREDFRDVIENPGGVVVTVYATEYSPLMGQAVFGITACPIPINVARDKERIEKVLVKLSKKLRKYYK